VSFQDEPEGAWVAVKVVDVLSRWNKNGEFWANIKITSPTNRVTKKRADMSFLFYPNESDSHIPAISSTLADIETNPGPRMSQN
jgi:hypothetical protein